MKLLKNAAVAADDTVNRTDILLAGGVIAGVIAGFYLMTYLAPSRDELSRQVELKKQYLVKQKELIGQEEWQKNRREQCQEQLKKSVVRLLDGTTPAIAGAELQSLLSDLATASGVEITRKTTRQEQKLEDDIIRVTVQIEINATPDQLVHFLAAMETSEKYLSIDDMAVVVMSQRRMRRIRRMTSPSVLTPDAIRPTLTVSGYIAAAKAEIEPASQGVAGVEGSEES